MNNLLKLTCDTCQELVIPIEGMTAIFSRGYWWHTKCCGFDFEDGKPIVAFLSKGKLIPNTILHKEINTEVYKIPCSNKVYSED